MRFWFSPLPIPGALISELAEAGLEPWPSDQGSPNVDTCLLVYDSPERYITAAAETNAMEVAVYSSAALSEGYSRLLACRRTSGQMLLAGWRLERLGGLGLHQWLAGNGPRGLVGDAEPINPLIAGVILSLLETHPQLLEDYSELELQGELIGSEADLNYRRRLLQAVGQGDPLPQFLRGLQTQREARMEAERTRLELQKVDEKMEQLVLADGLKQEMLTTRTQELQNLKTNIEALQQELQHKVDNLSQQLLNSDKLLQESRDNAEVTLNQLHQVQEELQQLLLSDRQKEQLLDTRNQEIQSLHMGFQALQQELTPKVANLNQQLLNSKKLLQESRDNAEVTLNQLHQVQEELEQLFLSDRRKQLLLDARNQELESLRVEFQALQQELQPKVSKLEQQTQASERDLRDARNDAELTMMQLQQVQEELERYFLQTRSGSQLIDAQTNQLSRAKRLMAKIAIKNSNPRTDIAAVAVEVLPQTDPISQQPSLQLQALLNAYTSSIDRASRLLTRAMKK